MTGGGRRCRVALAVVMVIDLVVLLTLSDRASLWGDEGFTARMMQQPFGHMVALFQHIDINMSTYYLVTRAFTEVGGTSATVIRLSSVVSSVAAVGVIYLLVAKLYGERVALAAAVVVACNPFVADIAVDARGYAMLSLAVATSSLLLLRAVERGTRAGDWVAVAVVDVLGSYVSLLFLVALAIQAGWLLAVVRRPKPVHLATVAVVAVGLIPTALFVAPKNTLYFTGPFTLTQATYALRIAAGGHVLAILVTLLLAAAVVRLPTVIAGPGGSPGGWPRRLYLPVLAIAPLVVLFLLAPYQSLFQSEYVYLAIPLCLALAAVRLATMRPRVAGKRAAGAAATLAVVFGLVNLAYFVHDTVPAPSVAPEDWRGASRLLDSVVAPGDAVATPSSFYRNVLEYYGTPGQGWERAHPALPDAAWNSLDPYELDRLERLNLQSSPALIRSEVAGYAHVWVVDFIPPAGTLSVLLADGYHVSRMLHVTGTFIVLLVRGG